MRRVNVNKYGNIIQNFLNMFNSESYSFKSMQYSTG